MSESNILPLKEFAERLTRFCHKNTIGARKLSEILGYRKNMLYSNCHRLMRGSLNPKHYASFIAALEPALENFMIQGSFAPDDIENELNHLFPHRKDRTMIAKRCVLPAAAIKFFGLKQDPFDVDRIPLDDELFSNDELDEVARRIIDAVLNTRFIGIVGGVGSGKTSMKIRAARELETGKQKVRLIFPEFFDMSVINPATIATAILDEFEVPVPRNSTARVRKIREILTNMRKDGIRVALVFDECQWLNEKVVRSLKNFWEMTNGNERLLAVILFGQPRFIDATLRDQKFKEIAERVQIINMPDMARSARDYLAHKLAAAGGNIEQLFDERAVERICRYARTPLALGNLANESLLEAFKLEEKQVKPTMLRFADMPQARTLRRVS